MNSLSYYMIYLAAFGLLVNFAAAQTMYTVGDSMGWTIPPNSSLSYYSNWASGKKFMVGDTLVFNFTTGVHDVIQVPKASYDGCSDDVTLGDHLTVGPVSFTLSSAGNSYYICSFGSHCLGGQKLPITVVASPTPVGSPPTAVPPPTTPTTPLPATPPPTTPTASSPPPTTTPTASSPPPPTTPTTPLPATPPLTTPTASSPPPPITSTTPSPATPRPPPPMSSSSVSLGGSFFIIIMCVALALII